MTTKHRQMLKEAAEAKNILIQETTDESENDLIMNIKNIKY